MHSTKGISHMTITTDTENKIKEFERRLDILEEIQHNQRKILWIAEIRNMLSLLPGIRTLCSKQIDKLNSRSEALYKEMGNIPSIY